MASGATLARWADELGRMAAASLLDLVVADAERIEQLEELFAGIVLDLDELRKKHGE